ncbi:hypothetical protein RG963_14790 [Methanosarcina sp. Z-7115]|uniref:Uncharacterized protein n=1 Tax=Methanosarcina baikalica TaxID=3073890 RepID=A0ABU2D4W4_9EURY|nr:hypothetical protein [Methanosarcina sp. Z-7115]MDR7667024.1 hypothetical protein [Methanosarcina sp. Z-7115]
MRVVAPTTRPTMTIEPIRAVPIAMPKVLGSAHKGSCLARPFRNYLGEDEIHYLGCYNSCTHTY